MTPGAGRHYHFQKQFPHTDYTNPDSSQRFRSPCPDPAVQASRGFEKDPHNHQARCIPHSIRILQRYHHSGSSPDQSPAYPMPGWPGPEHPHVSVHRTGSPNNLRSLRSLHLHTDSYLHRRLHPSDLSKQTDLSPHSDFRAQSLPAYCQHNHLKSN